MPDCISIAFNKLNHTDTYYSHLQSAETIQVCICWAKYLPHLLLGLINAIFFSKTRTSRDLPRNLLARKKALYMFSVVLNLLIYIHQKTGFEYLGVYTHLQRSLWLMSILGVPLHKCQVGYSDKTKKKFCD